jgi:hypothetical protein
MSAQQSIYTRLFADKQAKKQFTRDNARVSRKMNFALADDLLEAERLLAESTDKADGYIAMMQNAVTVVEELQRELENALGNYQLEEQTEEADRLLQEFNDNAFESAAYVNLKQTLSRANQATLDFLDWKGEVVKYLNL